MKTTIIGAAALAVALGTALGGCSKSSYYRYHAFPEFTEPPAATAPDGDAPLPVATPPVPQSEEFWPSDDSVEVATFSPVLSPCSLSRIDDLTA